MQLCKAIKPVTSLVCTLLGGDSVLARSIAVQYTSYLGWEGPDDLKLDRLAFVNGIVKLKHSVTSGVWFEKQTYRQIVGPVLEGFLL